ncbi:general secretion pathway protein B [Shewanella sediminis HAW-EB3]|uniref:General secretion pathway protein B n=1 Tax=Shewanella sediminis (strain HAW-EB3) TaxID=425104 RepID=A8FS74_SHESH|nr:general secretion pathway protein GspB [Shewanella sediminis]ABV35697.1 general secretion pathway protein B [Shewanella sediminis HAW-EB3]
MSILLEAVTRAKQQELESDLDPVLTPRAQYDNFSKPKNNTLMLSLIVIILSLLVVIVWLATSHFSSGNTPSVQVSSEARTPEGHSSVPLSTDGQLKGSAEVEKNRSASGDNDVKLAGKVALPLAMALPTKSVVVESRYPKAVPVQQRRVQHEKVSAVEVAQLNPESEPSSVAEEPIILGANSNHRGQEVLDALKYQVDEAASELGMNKAPVQSDTPEQKEQYQSKNNLLAAFEAALKEVEVEKSVASPVTEPKLDPIPTPKADDLPKYGQLPAGLQLQVPEFNINAHVYSSAPDNRWLNVDGAELQQGDMIGGKLEIIEIRPRDVVLAIEGTQFKVPAI